MKQEMPAFFTVLTNPFLKGDNALNYEKHGKRANVELISVVVLLILLLVLLFFLSKESFLETNSQAPTQITDSELINTKEIATLSVSEFVYNGIAQAIKENGEIDYNVLYKSTVKVSIDANKIRFIFNEEQMKVTFFFPEFTVESPVIDVSSISLIPQRQDLFLEDVIKLCRDDALAETKESEKLLSSAQENLRLIIEGWYSSVLDGFSFEYQFGTAEDGDTI